MRALLPARARRLVVAVATIAALAPLPAQAITRVTDPDTVLAVSNTPTSTTTNTVTPTNTAAQWVGVYRVTMVGAAGSMIDARIMIERYGDRLAGVLLVDQQASGLSDVRVEDNTLSVGLQTADGRGRLVLRPSDAGVAGTLTVGKKSWSISGARSI